MIARIARLPLQRKFLLARVALLLLAVHGGLRVFPFAKLYNYLGRWRKPSRSPGKPEAVDAVCRAVMRSGAVLFGDAGCLPQAIVGELLLVRLGVPAEMRIGVSKDPAGRLLAHAYVAAGDRTLIGGSRAMEDFTGFPAVKSVLESQRRPK